MRPVQLLPAVALVLVACGPADSANAPEAGTTTSPSRSATSSTGAESTTSAATATPAATGTVIRTGSSAYGRMLFDRRGQAIYLFDKETSDRPRCSGACAVAWPPVLTTDEPRAGRGARPALLGTTERADGSQQVTYAGHPLYFYAHEGPGEVLCHDIEEYGGTWLVVRPSGNPAP